jgi:ribose transport system ATP-binding protein
VDLPLDAPAGRLSVAEQQLVEIARSVAVGCRVLVLDEPTSSLAQQDVQRLFALIRRLRERGLAIIYISHFLEEVMELGDRFTVLRDGLISGGGGVAGAAPADIAAMMVGRRVDDLYPRSPRLPGEVVLAAARRSGGRGRDRGRGAHRIPTCPDGSRPNSLGGSAGRCARGLAAAKRSLAAGHGPGQRGSQE